MVKVDKMWSANDKQVGGGHYRPTTLGVSQHWDIVNAMGWDYYIGNATKYLWRFGKKDSSKEGMLQDLEKAIHYLEKKRELMRAAEYLEDDYKGADAD